MNNYLPIVFDDSKIKQLISLHLKIFISDNDFTILRTKKGYQVFKGEQILNLTLEDLFENYVTENRIKISILRLLKPEDTLIVLLNKQRSEIEAVGTFKKSDLRVF